ncbi:MAG: sensor histidine kinase [Opitutales bacterium]|nr:sensor histidine kinase [Opitutales bacterium]
MRNSRYRLAWSICLLLLIGFIANSISSYYVSRDNVRRTITDSSLPLTSDNIYSVIQRDLLQPVFISSMMANDAFLREWAVNGEQDPAQIQRYLSEIRRAYDTVTSFFVSEISRNYYYFGGILKQVDPDEERDVWYFRVREMDEPFEINVDYDMANQDAMTIFVNYRVYDFDGNYIGATGTGLTVTRVNELIYDYQDRFGREIFFVDRSGEIVLGPQSIARFGSIHDVPGLSSRADALLEDELEDFSYRRDGETYFVNSRFVPEFDWFLIVEQTENQLLAPLRETLFMNLGLALIITFFVALICVTTIRRHQRKLEFQNDELLTANREIAEQKTRLESTAAELEQANQSLSELNREKDDFLSIVAHDLRNPLNGVLGFSEEIRHRLPEGDPIMHEYLDEVRNSAYHMLDLISDILNVSSIESFNGDLRLSVTNWNELVQEACDLVAAQAARKRIGLRAQLDPDSDAVLKTRPKWMSICINNLLSNAVKYAPKGSKIEVTTRRVENGFEIEIKDEGPGLKPDELQRVFEKFVRLSPQPTAGETSTGLGLYIVQKMCKRLGAKVRVDSEFGHGAVFTIWHPDHVEDTL